MADPTYQPTERRPIASRDLKASQVIAAWLAAQGILAQHYFGVGGCRKCHRGPRWYTSRETAVVRAAWLLGAACINSPYWPTCSMAWWRSHRARPRGWVSCITRSPIVRCGDVYWFGLCRPSAVPRWDIWLLWLPCLRPTPGRWEKRSAARKTTVARWRSSSRLRRHRVGGLLRSHTAGMAARFDHVEFGSAGAGVGDHLHWQSDHCGPSA